MTNKLISILLILISCSALIFSLSHVSGVNAGSGIGTPLPTTDRTKLVTSTFTPVQVYPQPTRPNIYSTPVATGESLQPTPQPTQPAIIVKPHHKHKSHHRHHRRVHR